MTIKVSGVTQEVPSRYFLYNSYSYLCCYSVSDTAMVIELNSPILSIRHFDNQSFFPVVKRGDSKKFLNMWVYFNGIPSKALDYQCQIEMKNENTKLIFEAKTLPLTKYQDKVSKSQTCLVLSKEMLKNLQLTKLSLEIKKI